MAEAFYVSLCQAAKGSKGSGAKAQYLRIGWNPENPKPLNIKEFTLHDTGIRIACLRVLGSYRGIYLELCRGP